jgi:protein TonB
VKNILVVTLLSLLVVGGLGWWIYSAAQAPVEKPANTVQVQLIRPPPPAPPPPPPPPPPEEDVDVPEPEEVPDIPEPNLEPAPDSGVDAPAGEGMQVAGGGGGGNRDSRPYNLAEHQRWYAQKARDRIRALLSRRAGIKKGEYKVPIRLWIDVDGGLERYELMRSTGDPAVDREIEAALAEFGRMGERRPEQLPPFRVRVEFRA